MQIIGGAQRPVPPPIPTGLQRYIHRYICKFWLMNKICNDSSKVVNAEIEFSGADNESRIVVTRIRGSESDRSSFRFWEV